MGVSSECLKSQLLPCVTVNFFIRKEVEAAKFNSCWIHKETLKDISFVPKPVIGKT